MHRSLLAVVLLSVLALRGVSAQQYNVTGTVRDGATGQPVFGAIVSLSRGDNERVARTDQGGGFAFTNVPSGSWMVYVRRLGYEPTRRAIEVQSGTVVQIDFTITRLVALDTVRVRAAPQAIYGVVGVLTAARELRPLPNATVQVVGLGSMRATTDSGGHFFIALKNPGPYVVRAQAKGFVPQTLSVTLAPHDGAEVAFLMDTALQVSHRLTMAYQDFDDRLKVKGIGSALVTREDLMRSGNSNMLEAIRFSRSFSARALVMGAYACVFLDGIAKPNVQLSAVDPRDVEAVEVYTRSGDRTGSLAQRWPSGTPCPPSGAMASSSLKDQVYWVALWLKH